jgi:hypothetical protein
MLLCGETLLDLDLSSGSTSSGRGFTVRGRHLTLYGNTESYQGTLCWGYDAYDASPHSSTCRPIRYALGHDSRTITRASYVEFRIVGTSMWHRSNGVEI